MKKRFLSMVLCLCMVLSLLPGTAFAAETVDSGSCGSNLTWSLDSDGTLRIMGTGQMYDYGAEHYQKNTIPSEYGDDDVWFDGSWYYHITSPWFSHHKDIKHLVIEDGVTSIGKYAFCACENMQDVTMPTSLTSIGRLAFWSCNSISRIEIPDGVIRIGEQAFYQCEKLVRVDIADSVTTIEESAFDSCQRLSTVNLSKNITILADGIFSNCIVLERIMIPNGVTSIGSGAFFGCSSLQNITIPDSVTRIGVGAFSSCTSLTSISIPANVTAFFVDNDGLILNDISCSPFGSCTSMTEIHVDAENPSYKDVDGVLYNKDGTILISYPAGKPGSTFAVPSGVSDISWRAFFGASNLTQVALPEGITEINFYTFQNCTNLKSVNVPDGVTVVYPYAFSNCANLQSIIIPEGVTQLCNNAFENCTNLESITIPTSVTQIDGDDWIATFKNCDKLTIYCYKDSYAHQFAQDEEIPFVLLDEDPDPEEPSITLSPETLDLSPGKTGEITVTTTPAGSKYILTSSDGEVASVFGTTLTAHKLGRTEITAALVDHPDVRAVCSVTVTELDPEHPSITLSPKTLDLSIGKTGEVTATTTPTGARYTLTSSDPEVVSVSGNTLTAHKLGRGEITAALVDYPNVQAVCSVAVKEGYDDLMCAIAACQLAYEDKTLQNLNCEVSDFAEKVIRPTQKQLWKGYFGADMADFYSDVLAGWTIKDVMQMDSGFFAVALDNAERNQRIIAFRGTQDFGDIDTDLQFAVWNKLSPQFDEAVAFYTRNSIENKNILLTGHSLGGALACYVSLLTGERTETFNGANGLIIDDTYFAGAEDAFFSRGEELLSRFHGANRWNFTNHVTESENTASLFIPITASFNKAVAYPNADKLSVEIHTPAITATTAAVSKNNCHDLCTMLEYDESTARFRLTDSTPYNQPLPTVRQFEMRAEGKIRPRAIFYFGSSGNDEITDKRLIHRVFLYGGDGNDHLVSWCANDVLVGGLGANVMDGGPMDDRYVITGTDDQYINDCSGKDDIYISRGVRVKSFEEPDSPAGKYFTLTLTNGQKIMLNRNRKQDNGTEFYVFSMDGALWGPYQTISQEPEAQMMTLAAQGNVVESTDGLPITTLEISGRDLILEVQDDAGNSVGTVHTATDSFPLYKPYGYFYYDRQGETLRAHLFGGSGEVRISSADPAAQTVACTSIFHNAEDDLPLKRFTAEIDLQASETILTPSCVAEEPAVPFRVMDSNGNTENISAKTEDLTVPPKPDNPEQPIHYTLTVTGGSGSGSYSAGTRISISATIPSGKRFVRWEASGGTIEDYLSASTYFVMPNGDVTLTAILTDESTGGTSGGSSGSNGWSVSTTYAVTVEEPEHGKVTSNRTNTSSGSTVTLTTIPDSGYVLDTLTVTDNRGNKIKLTEKDSGKYTFTMPSGAVTVKAIFVPLPDDTQKPCDGGADCPSHGFTDLGSVGTWYHEAVDYVLRNRMMDGYGNETFGPNDNLSRAQFAQILHNREGKPTVTGGSAFTDVVPGQWYTPAITWAAANGIVGGYGNGLFGPNDKITREQLAVMLWRYAGEPAATNKELKFSDAGESASYALDALRWTVENEIIKGKGGGILDPKGLATRAQVAQMLKNYLEH